MTTQAPTTAPAEPTAFTTAQKSDLAAHLLPVLLVLGLIGLLAAPMVVLLGRPGGAGLAKQVRARFARKPEPPKG